MDKFKKGETLKRTRDTAGDLPVGSIVKVTRVSDGLVAVELNGVALGGMYSDSNFELSKYPNPPHEHTKEMIAFAEGANIQMQLNDMSWGYDKYPSWHENNKYRTEPEKTAKDLEIERIELEIRKLADDLSKLKDK